MTPKLKQNARKIAETSLRLGSIKLAPTNPFKWASGTMNPIYNDNRMLLSKYESRQLVANSLMDLLNENQIDIRHVDYICGTSLSGIAPATTLANLLGKKLLIFVDGIPYEFIPNQYDIICDYDKSIVSSAPFGIPIGVMIANEHKLPFSYVRPQQKKHGLMKLIEGAEVTSGNFDLINIGSQQDITDCRYLLDDTNLHCHSVTNHPLEKFFQKADLQGKCVIVVEDLISTGASFAKEADACKSGGAEVLCVVAIFDYGLESSKELIAKTGYDVYSALNYEPLLETGVELGYIKNTDVSILRDWRIDQPNWGKNHGFS